MIKIGDIVTLKDGRKGEVFAYMPKAEKYLLAYGRGGQLGTSFTVHDVVDEKDGDGE